MTDVSRRDFLATTAAAAVLAQSTARAASDSANERINLCVIGIRGRGGGLARGFAGLPNARVSHVCDVNESLLGPFAQQINDIQQVTPKTLTDLRRALDDREIDAIVVGTPDHWHALATIWGCQAGKHVYVEKPISNNVNEGRQMVAAARKHNRVVQVGTQSRSAPHYREVMEMIRGGRIGRVHMAKAFNSQLRRKVPAVADSAIPDGLDWNIWQGPAPERPYNLNCYTYGWRWLWDYGTGDMGNDGVHDLDIARWGLGVDYPTEVLGMGDKLEFVGDIQETPDTQVVSFRFPEQQATLVYEQRLWSPYHQEGYENGCIFYGTSGYIAIGRRGWKLVEARNKVAVEQGAEFGDTPHQQNFLDCIRSGKLPNCDIEEGYKSTLLAHLGNLTCRLKRPLAWDAATHSFGNDSEANALLSRPGRAEFVIPQIV